MTTYPPTRARRVCTLRGVVARLFPCALGLHLVPLAAERGEYRGVPCLFLLVPVERVERLERAEVVDPSVHHGKDQVFFGATVTYARPDGSEVPVTILGIDEADGAEVPYCMREES